MDIKKKLDQDSRYKAVNDSILREDYFYEYIKILKEERKKEKAKKAKKSDKKEKKKKSKDKDRSRKSDEKNESKNDDEKSKRSDMEVDDEEENNKSDEMEVKRNNIQRIAIIMIKSAKNLRKICN
jgi:transcription elongation regulator 1